MRTDQPTIDNASSESSWAQDWWHRTPLWAKVFALPLVTGFTGMTFLLTVLRLAPLPDESLANPTEISTADGQPLAEWTLKGTHPERVPLEKIPKALQDATIAVEDAHFYEHHAFNPLSLARATLVDLRHGRIVEGGSTITQQLAKNLFLKQDRTLTRKLKEALYAIQLELHESKRTILGQYLNVVYYGHGAYGIDSASRIYFNKDVSQLTLPECALLAGLPKGPSIYSPYAHFSAAKERQRVVLERMVATGYITQQQADDAYRAKLKLTDIHNPAQAAPYFTSTVLQEVQNRFHVNLDALYQGDVSITSTLDPVLQQAAERAIQTTLPKDGNVQAAIVALDPQTGAIRAMVGGRDYATSPYNRVMAERQPGSTFKAILYSTALENRWSPANQINSKLTTFMYDQNKLYTVHDYGDFYADRPLTLREALARSDNVYAVTTNLDVGPDKVIDTARKMGITDPLKPFPSLALGVFPVSPLEMATAYATLASGGYHVTPYAVEEVRSARERRVLQTEAKKEKVLSPQVCFQMTDLLRSVLEPGGTGYSVHQYLHTPAAAKTGTTNTDAWMVGYTPTVVCAVWVGYDNNQPLSTSEAHLAAPIWAKFMGTAEQRNPAPWFTVPPGLVAKTIDPVTAQLATDTCRDTETDYFQAGTEPTEMCKLHPPLHVATPAQSWLPKWLRKWF